MKHLTCLTLSLSLVLGVTNRVLPQPQACKPGSARNTAYMQRDGDKRCEGITTPQASLPDFGLSSLSIGQLQDSPNLALTIPKAPRLSQPKVRIQAITPSTKPNVANRDKYYQLDPLALKDGGQQWQFQWTNAILSQENIPLTKLRGIAQAEPGNIILPIRFSSSPTYDLRIYTGNRTKTITFRIIDSKNVTVYSSKPKTNQPGTEVAFSWDGRTTQNKPAPAGRYTLRLDAEVERPNVPADRRQDTRQFEHNPAWLK